MIPVNLERLCRRLDYEFKNIVLLKQALTHCSVGSDNYERFEFLGDAILSFVIANSLFQLFKDKSEGQLSRLRAFLVKGETLSEIATEIELSDYLYLGQGELKSGGFRRTSILADALEAIIAAVFLDNGFAASEKLILHLYQSRLQKEALDENLKDPKTQLQEQLQAKKLPLPTYALVEVVGEAHEQVFHVSCSVEGLKISTLGQGSSRRKAEQEAALLFLKKRF